MDDRKDKSEAELDETLDESFPASDPPANTVETGIAGSPQDVAVSDNRAENRLEARKNGQLAFLYYDRTPNSINFIHTEVPESLRGHHIGEALVTAGLAGARSEGLRVIATCPFVQSYLRKHPEANSAR